MKSLAVLGVRKAYEKHDSSARPQTGLLFKTREIQGGDGEPRKAKKRKTSIFEVPRSRRIDPYKKNSNWSYSDPFRPSFSFSFSFFDLRFYLQTV